MRALVRIVVLLALCVAFSFAASLVAYGLVGAEAHPMEAAFVGGLVVLGLQVAAAVMRGGDES